MRKKIFSGIAVLAIVAVSAWNVSLNTKSNNLSDVSLVNVEALANPDGSGSIEVGTNGSGIYAKATYGWKFENGQQLKFIAGCEVSSSGSCTLSAGVSWNF
jgi:hypothetical protein